MTPPGGEKVMTAVVCSADTSCLKAICEVLVDRGFGVLPAADAEAASLLWRYGRAEALILDLGLPAGSASDLLRRRTGDPSFPDLVVLALASGDEDPPPAGPDPALAVDDLLEKPFDLDHIVNRLEAALRRLHRRDDAVLRLGELIIDPPRHRVTVGDHEVRLARKEFVLLRVLASDPTRVFPKEELLRDIWGGGRVEAGARSLDSHASRLRRKLDRDGRRYVINCWGVGYRLLDSVPDPRPDAEGEGDDR